MSAESDVERYPEEYRNSPNADRVIIRRYAAEIAPLRERSWALSVILARIDDAELSRIITTLGIPELNRITAVVEGYYADVLTRDALALSQEEGR